MGVCKSGSCAFLSLVYLLCQTHLCTALPMNISSTAAVNQTKGVEKINFFKSFHSVPSRQLPKKCEAGVVYNITYIKELHDKRDELECIFHAGISPSKVPEGTAYGGLMDLAGYRFANPIAPYVWKGKFIETIDCNGKEIHRGMNILFGQPLFFFTARVSRLSDDLNFHKLEKYTDKKMLMIDYSSTVYDDCPGLNPILEKNEAEGKGIVRKPSNKMFYPVNQVLDVVSLVGRQPDGGAILFGKPYGKDLFSSDRKAIAIAYFYLISYDPTLNPDFKPGDALPPTEEAFYYRQTSLTEIFTWLLPVDNYLSEPIHSATKLLKELIPFGQSFVLFLIDLFTGIGSADKGRLLKEVQYNRPFNYTKTGLEANTSTGSFLSHYESAHSHSNEL